MAPSPLTLRAILDRFTPSILAQRCVLPHHRIRDGFRCAEHQARIRSITTFEPLKQLLLDYYNHHSTAWRAGYNEIDPEWTWGTIFTLLQTPEQTTPDRIANALNGLHGGIPALLDTVMQSFIDESRTQFINLYLQELIRPLTTEERLPIAHELRDSFGIFFAGEYAKHPLAIARDLEDIIRAHILTRETLRP